MMNTFETRSEIKARIMREAAREWGFKSVDEIDLNAFDPFIDLMMGACAFELEKLSHEILNAKTRIFERLIEVLMPEVLASAQPAHAIFHGAPVEASYVTKKEDQFYCKSLGHKKELFFSPLDEYPLFDARIEVVAFNDSVFRMDQRGEKDLISKASYGLQLSQSSYFIGIKTNPHIRTLDNFSFYFNWNNEPGMNELLQYLSTAQWFVGEHSLETRVGNTSDQEFESSDSILEALGFNSMIHKNINGLWKPHFVSITDDEIKIADHRSKHPQAFNKVFEETALEELREELLWIEIKMPSYLNGHLDRMQCLLNCFPIINRKLIEKQDKLEDNLHILPLELLGEYFLGIEQVNNSSQVPYSEISIRDIDHVDFGMYALRSSGVKRFDKRDAKEMLEYTIGLLASESSSFKGIAYSALASDFKELDQTFNRIKKNVNLSNNDLDNECFLFAKPFLNDQMIYLKYWTSEGDRANGLPRNTILKLHKQSNFQANTCQLITSTRGGLAPKKKEESINQFKEVVLSRNRIVTKQDIVKMAWKEIGASHVKHISVENGILLDNSGHNGLQNCLFVNIERQVNTAFSEEEFVLRCQEVERRLNDHSTGVYPIVVKVKETMMA